jgi:hypothetical protein
MTPKQVREADEEHTEVREVRQATGAWAKELVGQVLSAKDKDEDEVRLILKTQIEALQAQLERQAQAHAEQNDAKDTKNNRMIIALLGSWAVFVVIAIVLFAYLAGFRGNVDVDLKAGKAIIEAPN